MVVSISRGGHQYRPQATAILADLPRVVPLILGNSQIDHQAGKVGRVGKGELLMDFSILRGTHWGSIRVILE